MYCKNCGQQIDDNAAFCTNCGFAKNTGSKYCPNCGKEIVPGAAVCTNCGFALAPSAPAANADAASGQKEKLIAGILVIFLGGLGIHNFYLGFNKRGTIQLLVSLLTCGIGASVMGVWGLIEGIFYLIGKDGYTADANGTPLK